MKNKQFTLTRRPQAKGIAANDITLVQTDCPEPAEGEVRVRVIYLSIDPTIRLWLNETPPVVAAIPLGSVVPSQGIGIVEHSRDAVLPVGTLVSGMLGWQHYCTCPGKTLQALAAAEGLPLSAHLSLLGATGLTAYFGLLDLGKPKSGDTVLVSGAAGAVGSLVGQIAKIQGCTVIGIAGSADKCRFLTEQLCFDRALNYRQTQFAEQLAALGGVDVFFDNVGGAVREQGMLAMNDGGRIVICGEIASDYKDNSGSGIDNSFQIITSALQLFGLRVDRYFNRAGEAIPRLTQWARSGQLQLHTQQFEGLDEAPKALNQLFSGGNIGKTLVRVSAEPIPNTF